MTDPLLFLQPDAQAALNRVMCTRMHILFDCSAQMAPDHEPTFDEFKLALVQTYLYDPNPNFTPPQRQAEFDAMFAASPDTATLVEEPAASPDTATLVEEPIRQMYEAYMNGTMACGG